MQRTSSIPSFIAMVALVALGAGAVLAPVEASPGKKGGGAGGPHGRDRTAPTLTVPADITVDARAPMGAVVWFTVTATDDKDWAPRVVVSPRSNSTFPVGTTTVTATATDSSGNSTTKSFEVTVLPMTGPITWRAAMVDNEDTIYFVWDITIAPDGTVSGTGVQTYLLDVYGTYDLYADTMPAGLSGAGTVSGTMAPDGSCQFVSSRNYWYWEAGKYDEDWNPVYDEDVGGFSGATTARFNDWGQLVFSADPLAIRPRSYVYQPFWYWVP